MISFSLFSWSWPVYWGDRSAAAQVEVAALYHLDPPNLHLTFGETSTVPLTVRDQAENLVVEPMTFYDKDTGLISVSAGGSVTAHPGRRRLGIWHLGLSLGQWDARPEHYCGPGALNP